MTRRLRELETAALFGLLVTACGTSPAAVPDAGTDAGERVLAPPAPPAFTPCPPGWREVVDTDVGLTTCDPWPEGGNASATCAPDEAHFPGTPGCAPVGTPCAADGWPVDLPTDRPIVYVDDGAAAGGNGTSRARAFSTIAAATTTAPAGAVIAVATGRYDEPPLTLGARVTLWGACVADTQLTASVAGDEPLLVLRGAGAAVRNLAIDHADRISIGVLGTDVAIEDVVERGARFAIFVQSGSATVHRVAIRDGRTEPDGSEGRAIDVGRATHVVLDTVVIERNPQFGVWVGGAGAVVEARDLAVTDIAPTGSLPGSGRGLYADEGARFELERVVIERSSTVGIFLHGATTTAQIRDVVIRDVRSGAGMTLGRGISIEAGAQMVLDRVLVDGAREVGLFVYGNGADATWHDGAVVRMQSAEATLTHGRGVVVAGGAHAALERLVVDQAREAALLAGLDGTRVEITDARLRRTLPNERNGAHAVGVWAQDDAQVTLLRTAIDTTSLVGVMALTRASVELRDVAVTDVTAAPCASTTCTDMSGAFGLAANLGAVLSARGFSVERAATCGILVGVDDPSSARPTAVDLASGVVSGAAVGACIQVDGYDITRLASDVAYRDVGALLQATTYPLPEAFAGFAP